MDATDELDDRDALARCIPAARAADPIYDRAIDTMFARGQSWEEVANYACFIAQTTSLNVMPWQRPPCRIHLESALRQPFGDPGGEREGAEIRLKLRRSVSANSSPIRLPRWSGPSSVEILSGQNLSSDYRMSETRGDGYLNLSQRPDKKEIDSLF